MCMHACIHVCIHIYMCACVCACMCVGILVDRCVVMNVCKYGCAIVYLYLWLFFTCLARDVTSTFRVGQTFYTDPDGCLSVGPQPRLHVLSRAQKKRSHMTRQWLLDFVPCLKIPTGLGTGLIGFAIGCKTRVWFWRFFITFQKPHSQKMNLI